VDVSKMDGRRERDRLKNKGDEADEEAEEESEEFKEQAQDFVGV